MRPGDGGGTVAVAKRKHRRNLSASAFSGTVGVAADEINKRNHNQDGQDLSSHAIRVCVPVCVCLLACVSGRSRKAATTSLALPVDFAVDA